MGSLYCQQDSGLFCLSSLMSLEYDFCLQNFLVVTNSGHHIGDHQALKELGKCI